MWPLLCALREVGSEVFVITLLGRQPLEMLICRHVWLREGVQSLLTD